MAPLLILATGPGRQLWHLLYVRMCQRAQQTSSRAVFPPVTDRLCCAQLRALCTPAMPHAGAGAREGDAACRGPGVAWLLRHAWWVRQGSLHA